MPLVVFHSIKFSGSSEELVLFGQATNSRAFLAMKGR